MTVMENPETSNLDLFALDAEQILKQKRLAEAWKKDGKEGLRRELSAMYPEKVNSNPCDAPKSRS